jgi:hypothetical protein
MEPGAENTAAPAGGDPFAPSEGTPPATPVAPPATTPGVPPATTPPATTPGVPPASSVAPPTVSPPAPAWVGFAPQRAYPPPQYVGYAPETHSRWNNFGTQPYPYVPTAESAPDAAGPEPRPPFFDLAAGTEFPLGLGPQLTLEVPFRILLQAEAAWMPAAYGSTINAFIQAFGREGAVVGPVIEEALADSFVFRASGGWRPFKNYGFEITAGYTLIKVAGEAPAEIVGDIADDFEDRIDESQIEAVAFDSTLHNFHVALGWRWLLFEDHMVIRVNLGYTQTVGASSSIELPEHPELETELNPVVDEELERILTRDIKLPVIGLNAGYRFY